jgi:hypothetical protein
MIFWFNSSISLSMLVDCNCDCDCNKDDDDDDDNDGDGDDDGCCCDKPRTSPLIIAFALAELNAAPILLLSLLLLIAFACFDCCVLLMACD